MWDEDPDPAFGRDRAQAESRASSARHGLGQGSVTGRGSQPYLQAGFGREFCCELQPGSREIDSSPVRAGLPDYCSRRRSSWLVSWQAGRDSPYGAMSRIRRQWVTVTTVNFPRFGGDRQKFEVSITRFDKFEVSITRFCLFFLVHAKSNPKCLKEQDPQKNKS